MMKLAEARNSAANYLTQPIVQLLSKTPVTPSLVTLFGFVLAVVTAICIVNEWLITAGVIMLVAGFFDMLDGALARHTKKVTCFGAFLDSALDRLSEAIILLGILIIQVREQSFYGTMLVSIALLSSLLVSYVRARAEALGLECKVGLFTRPERVLVLALGLLFSFFDYALVGALLVIVLLSLLTVGQRLFHVWRQTKTGI